MKFGTNNGTDDTSKPAKFYGIGYSTFRDMTSQTFPFEKETNHCDSIFTPWNRAKLEKITFYTRKHLFWHKIIPPLHFHCFQAKQKFQRFNFSRGLISKTTAATPLVNRFCQNSAKMCLIDKNNKLPSLEVLDKGVLELRSII